MIIASFCLFADDNVKGFRAAVTVITVLGSSTALLTAAVQQTLCSNTAYLLLTVWQEQGILFRLYRRKLLPASARTKKAGNCNLYL